LLSLTVYSVPTFWLGLMMILLFSGVLGIAPASGIQSPFAEDLPPLRRALDTLAHLALPALTLGLPIATYVARLLRSALLDTLDQPYIRNARARGLSETRVLWGHALRNCLGPLIQALGILLPALLGGAYLVEYVFSWPGLGTVSLRAIQSRDYPLVLATTLYTGGLVILGTLCADLLNAWLDPRVHEIEME
ncbi:MAG: ABC transporter permease, partial [Acidobacteriota bacterium]